MELNELVKEVMKKEKVTQNDLSDRLGKKQSNISQMLNRPGIHGDVAVEMLACMGYKLVAVKVEETVVG